MDEPNDDESDDEQNDSRSMRWYISWYQTMALNYLTLFIGMNFVINTIVDMICGNGTPIDYMARYWAIIGLLTLACYTFMSMIYDSHPKFIHTLRTFDAETSYELDTKKTELPLTIVPFELRYWWWYIVFVMLWPIFYFMLLKDLAVNHAHFVRVACDGWRVIRSRVKK